MFEKDVPANSCPRLAIQVAVCPFDDVVDNNFQALFKTFSSFGNVFVVVPLVKRNRLPQV
jgi:hypothetical protein